MARRALTKPRSFTPVPAAFGRDERIPWRHPLDLRELVGLRAAEVQHAVAVRTRTLVKKGPLKRLSALAERSGLERKRLSKLLSGDAVMSMRDYQALVLVLPELLSMTVERWPIQDPALLKRFPRLGEPEEQETAVPGRINS